jgi:hypothetical protein
MQVGKLLEDDGWLKVWKVDSLMILLVIILTVRVGGCFELTPVLSLSLLFTKFRLSIYCLMTITHTHTYTHRQYRGTISYWNAFNFTHSPLHLICVCLYSADTVDAGIHHFVNVFRYLLSVIHVFIAPTSCSLCSSGIWRRFMVWLVVVYRCFERI